MRRRTLGARGGERCGGKVCGRYERERPSWVMNRERQRFSVMTLEEEAEESNFKLPERVSPEVVF